MGRLLPVLLLAVAGSAIGCAVDPDPLPRYMQDAPRTGEDVKKAVGEIKKELGDEFEVDVVENIFYVAANGGVDEWKRCATTVDRMYRFLARDYFEKRPIRPIRVYCFKDARTYDAYCKETYQKPPSTPYGFYMPAERKMVMNISTGTGTLAHELVHPLLAEDFPTVPSWFNEGFASLYEESMQSVDGKMVGKVNWRLRGLRDAMDENRSITLDALLKTTTKEFYDETRGVHYATARYLCMWLQARGRLQEYYRSFRAAAKADPTGRATLEKIAEMKLDDLDAAWREWVVKLK